MKKYFSVIVLFFIGIQCFGISNPKVLQVTIDEGLINGNIHQITQDGEGFIWIATENGLARYDGYNYRIFQTQSKNPHSISHNFVNSVATSDGRSIWIGTMSGLDMFSPVNGTFQHFRFYSPSGNENMKPALKAIPFDSGCYVMSDDKSVYVCTENDDTLRAISYQKFNPTTFVTSIDLLENRTLIVGNKAGQVYTLSYDGSAMPFFSRNSAVSVVKVLKNKKICVCYADGEIYIFNNYNEQDFQHYKLTDVADTYINDVVEYNDEKLLVSTRSLGVYELSYETGLRAQAIRNLVNENCSTLYKDCFDNVWVGHSSGGISVQLANTVDFTEKSTSQKGEKILALSGDGQRLFIGTDGDGLKIKTANSESIYTYKTGIQGLPFDNVVTSLYNDGTYMWIGTYSHGVYALSLQTGRLQFVKPLADCPAKNIATIFSDSQGNVWIGTYENGVYVFSKDSKTIIRHYTGYEDDGNLNISCNGTTWFTEDSANSIWIGSYYGISKISKEGTSAMYHYDRFPGMRSSVVTTVSQDAEGRVWFGSLQGLGYYEAGNDTIFALANHQSVNEMAILEMIPQKDSSIIVVTPKSVYVYDKKDGHFHFVSSLQKGEFQRNAFYVSEKNNELFLGTNRGLKVLPLPIIAEKSDKHRIRLSDVLVNGKSLFTAESNYEVQVDGNQYFLQLPYFEKNITFRFSDFYFDPANYRDYEYVTENLTEEWTRLQGINEISYTNLSGGDYILYVKAIGDENSSIQVNIHINKAFWERPIFYILLLVVIFGIICFVLVNRMHRVIRMRNRLQRQVELRVQDIRRKTEQIELQNEQIRLQRDAATRQRSEAEKQRSGLEKRQAILSEKLQKNEEIIADLKQKSVSLNKEKLILKRKVDLFENNIREVVVKILLPSEKIDYISSSILDLTGYSDEEFYESSVSLKDLLPKEIRNNLKQYRTIVAQGQMPEVADFQIYTKEGVVKNIRQYSRYETNLKDTVIALEFVWIERTESELQNTLGTNQVAQRELVEEEPVAAFDWSEKTILVADDDNQSFAFIVDALAPTKIKIRRVFDGEEVVSVYRQSPDDFDILLISTQLPKKNGFEAVHEIREFDKQVPIIAQTMYGNYEAKIQCFDAGCDTYVSKPYKEADLQQNIRNLISKI